MRQVLGSLIGIGVVVGVIVCAHAVPTSGQDVSVATPSSRAPADTERARGAITRSLPLLQHSANTWFQEQRCSSCHHQGLGMMTVSLARDRGFAIDAGLLAAQVTKTVAGPSRAERLTLGEASINEAIGQSYRLVGLASTRLVDAPSFALVAHMLAGKQHVTGKWSSYSHRPPLEDGEMTATALSVRALRLFAHESRAEETRARLDRARRWLRTAPVESTEDAAMQILGLVWSGAPKATWRAAARRLKAAQQADGGWTQIPTRSSDAYATGEVVVALALAGELTPADPVTRRAVAFLLASQQGDGSWLVTTRRARGEGLPYFDSGFPHGKHQFISYAGTAWATMALLLTETTGDRSALVGDAPQLLIAKAATVPAALDPLSPLMRAALFGSMADVRAQLAKGADPNEATENGLTPLMCAAHDPGKVQVLLAAGARVDAAAKSGHTALVVAAGYDGAAASVDRLLTAGAPIAATTSTGIIPGSTPLARAVLRGDAAMVRTLVARGASVHGSKSIAQPLHLAVWQGDVAMTTLLLDLGARIDEPLTMEEEPAGQTPLMIAADDGSLPVVRLLLARGASVTLRDAEGLTPLMIAASAADRGSDAIVRALVAAGADPRATLPDGTTARMLAERFSLAAPMRALAAAPTP